MEVNILDEPGQPVNPALESHHLHRRLEARLFLFDETTRDRQCRVQVRQHDERTQESFDHLWNKEQDDDNKSK